MTTLFRLAILLTAYALGSIPTAVIYSRIRHNADIRELGDGNMGARNTKRQFGFKAGFVVALLDIFKGTLAVLLAIAFKFPLEWQLLTGAAVILGHDFPVFARFKGGQGFAATTGVFLALMPIPTLIGFVIYCILYLLFHSSDIAAGVGMGLITLHSVLTGQPFILVAFIVCSLVFIPIKKAMDRSRRERLKAGRQGVISHK